MATRVDAVGRERAAVAAKDDYLIDTMLDMGLLTHEQVEAGRAEAEAAGEGVLDTMTKSGSIEPAIVGMRRA